MTTMPNEVQPYEPLKLLILPKGTSPNARICTLAHPRTGSPSRYYSCPNKGIFEFTRIAAPKSTCRSWLLARQNRPGSSTVDLASGIAAKPDECTSELKGEDSHTVTELNGEARRSKSVSDGYVVETPELLVATPIDLLFLLLPSLQSKKLFLSVDDILDELCDTSKHFKNISNNERIRGSLEERISEVCDMVEAGDEKMYRLNTEKLLNKLLIKAKAMVASGLPTSMEDRFIRKALETPVMGLKREQSSMSDAVGASSDETSVLTPVPSEAADSQLSTTTSESAASESSVRTNITIPDDDCVSAGSDDINYLLRIRIALSYMMSSYIPASLGTTLNHQLSLKSPIDFTTLTEHLARITEVRTELLASRSLSDFSRKRSMNEDDEAAETRTEKKRKKEDEEKKKKAGESRGLRDLKKVDISGMKKMSDFFGKGAGMKNKR